MTVQSLLEPPPLALSPRQPRLSPRQGSLQIATPRSARTPSSCRGRRRPCGHAPLTDRGPSKGWQDWEGLLQPSAAGPPGDGEGEEEEGPELTCVKARSCADAVLRAIEPPQARADRDRSEKERHVWRSRFVLGGTLRSAPERSRQRPRGAAAGPPRAASPGPGQRAPGPRSAGGKTSDEEAASPTSVGSKAASSPSRSTQASDGKRRDLRTDGAEKEAGEAAETEQKFKVKLEAKRFEVSMCSFEELINSESSPMPLAEAMERLRPVSGGPNFAWDRSYEGAYGYSLNFAFQLVVWYANWDHPDIKTKTNTSISFMHKSGCAYIYQPVLPVTSLQISPRTTFRPMFDMDPRSFHVFKLAWRHFLDFGVSDFRIIVGEQLERWTQRCSKVIEKPMNATYWLMLMVGSYYRETLVKRKVLMSLHDADRIPVICVDSFVALSALLFSPERQVLYAGIDPTPSYLKWLQYVADQHSNRKNVRMRRRQGTVFEMNEFLDLSVIIVYYGRVLTKTKLKESTPLAWVGNPTLIKSYIARYAEDNRCESQLEHAVRIYTQTCALGKFHGQESLKSENPWFCWNGLKVCEVGVPMPCTQASFLSPFITTRPIAMMCQVHGPDATRLAEEAKKKQNKVVAAPSNNSTISSRRNSGAGPEPGPAAGGRKDEAHRSFSRGSCVSTCETPMDSSTVCSDDPVSTVHSSEEDSEKRCPSSIAMNTEFRIDRKLSRDTLYSDDEQLNRDGASYSCSCLRYIKKGEVDRKNNQRNKTLGTAQARPEMDQVLQALGDYDLLHCFAAVIAGGLNLAKMVVRLHFSIDPKAYANLPMPGRVSWQDSLYPWYREFHRPDVHGRSRYSCLLDSTLRGLLGDGYTGGLHMEVLDMVRTHADSKEEPVYEPAAETPAAKLNVAPTQEQAKDGSSIIAKKSLHMKIDNLRRQSTFHGLNSAKGAQELTMKLEAREAQPQDAPKSLGAAQPQQQEPSHRNLAAAPPIPEPAPARVLAPASPPQEAAHRALAAAQRELPEPPHRVLGKAMAQLHESLHRSLTQTQLDSAHRTLGLVQTTLPGQLRKEEGQASARWREEAPAPGLPPGAETTVSPMAGRRDKTFKGIISDIVLWTELYECESLMSIRGHFETFTQWCHSAHLVPFLQRCYRRLGVAGLVSSVHTGGHKHGMDPTHPLVLPTVAGFCYGHCYPLYRVLQYFYGGMEKLVCSIDDPQAVEIEKAALNLMPGQERLNNQCWFRTPDTEFLYQEEVRRTSTTVMDGLATRLTQQLEQEVKKNSKEKWAGPPYGPNDSPDLSRLSDSLGNAAKGPQGQGAAARNKSRFGAGFFPISPNKLLANSVGNSKHRNSSRNLAVQNNGNKKKAKAPTRFGVLAPDDPFFWFCFQNYMVYTYPALSILSIPRNVVLDGHCFSYKYSDFVSRTGTPEPRSDDADKSRAIGRVKPMPPSLCLCQPTELSQHVRQRWELPQTFVDEEKILLGDANWFPGALGHRFTFEAKTDNVARYVHLSLVPVAQLLYLENLRVPAKAKRKRAANKDLFEAGSLPRRREEANQDDSTSSSSGSDQDAGLGPKLLKAKATRWRGASRRRNGRAPASEQGPASLFAEEPVSVMLPPLLPGKSYV